MELGTLDGSRVALRARVLSLSFFHLRDENPSTRSRWERFNRDEIYPYPVSNFVCFFFFFFLIIGDEKTVNIFPLCGEGRVVVRARGWN